MTGIHTLAKNLKVALILLLASALSACSSGGTKEHASCERTDWYEIGRRDGSQGATSDKLAQHQARCGEALRDESETMYTNGRNAGLVEYCEPKNGYELGRMGIAYFYVCPSTVESAFLSAFRKCQRAHDLEVESNRLNLKIDELAQRLVASQNSFDQRQIASEITQLKRTRTQKEKELATITSN